MTVSFFCYQLVLAHLPQFLTSRLSWYGDLGRPLPALVWKSVFQISGSKMLSVEKLVWRSSVPPAPKYRASLFFAYNATLPSLLPRKALMQKANQIISDSTRLAPHREYQKDSLPLLFSNEQSQLPQGTRMVACCFLCKEKRSWCQKRSFSDSFALHFCSVWLIMLTFCSVSMPYLILPLST